MREPVPVDGAHLLEFVGSADLAVVLLSVHRWQQFNPSLGLELARHRADVALGTIDLAELLLKGGRAIHVLQEGFHRCGAPATFGLLPGYCLFRTGRMLAWDAGLPGLDDVGSIARGAILGVLWSGLTRDFAFLRRAVLVATEQTTAQRMAARFEATAAAPEPEPAPAGTPPPPPPDEVAWAYQVLGVDPSVGDREVHDAWRRRQKENHPDHAASDPAEFERRTRLSSDINRARDIVLEHRGRGPRRATGWAS